MKSEAENSAGTKEKDTVIVGKKGFADILVASMRQ
jgi:hypothetical protein